jgi:hypothetical protein
MSVLDDLDEVDDVSLNQILNNLLSAKENLELKTHVFKPKELSALTVLAKYLRDKEFFISATVLDNFIELYLKYMVSYKRLSRKEVIKALSSMIPEEEELSNRKKLTSNLK